MLKTSAIKRKYCECGIILEDREKSVFRYLTLEEDTIEESVLLRKAWFLRSQKMRTLGILTTVYLSTMIHL